MEEKANYISITSQNRSTEAIYESDACMGFISQRGLLENESSGHLATGMSKLPLPCDILLNNSDSMDRENRGFSKKIMEIKK